MQENPSLVAEMGMLAELAYKIYDPTSHNPNLNQISDSRLITNYTVVATQDTLLGVLAPNVSGFQAMLLQDTAGDYVIAFRGTETERGLWNFVSDLATDASMARANFTVQMSLALTFVKEALNRYSAAGLSIGNLTFTGHSLGGSLAEVAGYTFDVETYAFNPFGVKWSLTASPRYAATLTALDINSAKSADNITNVVNVGGAFSDPVTGIASYLIDSYIGEIVYVKDSAGGNTVGIAPHGMEELNTSIEVYNTLIEIFPNKDYVSLTAILDRIRPGNQQVPRFLQTLGEIVGANVSTDASVFAQNIKSAAPSGMNLIGLGDVNPSALQNHAAAPAYLYALLELNPFVVVGADYSHLNQNGELERNTYSDQFIEDRANFLHHLTCPSETSTDNIEFFDGTYGIVAYSNAGLPAEIRSQYLFGSKNSDTNLTGGDQFDHIYGLSGNDVLSGGGGDDFLEGGKGQDVMHGGTGSDTFFIQGQDTAHDEFQGGEGIDSILGGPGNDTIRVHQLLVSHSIEMIDGGGGYNLLSGTADGDIIDLSATQLANISEIRGGDGADSITGSGGTDNIYGDEGWDTLIGGRGNDTLAGGAGIDTYVIYSGDGADTIIDQGDNILMVNGDIIAGVFKQIGGTSSYALTVNNQDLVLNFGGTTTLTIDQSTSLIFAQQASTADFADHAFGITLCEEQTLDRALAGDDDADIVFAIHDSTVWYFGFSGAISGMGVRGYSLQGWKMFAYAASDPVPPTLQIEGNGGDDHLAGLAGADTINGGEGNDVLIGDLVLNPVGAGPYPDKPAWSGTGARDQLFGDAGRDALFGWQGDDLLFGGADNDVLSGEQDQDMLDGGNGDDLLAGGDGNDHLIGGGGNDVLFGDVNVNPDAAWNRIDMTTWGMSTGYSPEGWVASLVEQGFTLVQASVPGDDLLIGGSGNDLLVGGEGRDMLLGETGADRLEGGAGDDCLDGGDDNDLLLGEAGRDELRGGTGNDVLQGGMGDDMLQGDIGNDVLLGDEGHDILTAGGGNDYLDGGEGGDTYFFAAGFGHDTIFDTGASGTDSVCFLSQIVPEEVGIGQYQEHLILFIDGGNDTLAMMNWFTSGGSRIERLEFADGRVWDEAAITAFLAEPVFSPTDNNFPPGNLASVVVDGDGSGATVGDRYIPLPVGFIGNGTLSELDRMRIRAYGSYWLAQREAGDGSSAADKNIRGTGYDDYLYGGLGDDTLHGYGGNDCLSGGAGDDLIYGGIGQDRLLGGEGFDSLFGEEGDDSLEGGDGDDYLSDTKGNNILLGGNGDDQLLGGTGNDFMDGGDGDDSLVNIYDGGHDEMRGGAGNDRLTAGNGNDTLDGGDGDDELYGGGGNDTLTGGRGNDYIFDDEGENTFLFSPGDGQDTINAASMGTLVFAAAISPEEVVISRSSLSNDNYGAHVNCDDLIFSFAGNGDQVTVTGWSESRNLQVQFDDGTVWETSFLEQTAIVGTDGDDRVFNLWHDHSLRGGRYDDLLDGGAGNDDLFGGGGEDIFLFGRGDGQDTVFAGLGTETIRFKAGVAPEDVTSWIEDGNLCLAINGTGDRVTIQRELSHLVLGNYMGCQVGRVEFEDGTVWDETILYGSRFELQGTSEADVMSGTFNTDVFSGGAGNDILDTGDGDDILDGGAGRDYLTGGAGADHFLFNVPLDPANFDTITDFTAGEDTIQLNLSIFTALPSAGALSSELFTANTTGVATDANDYFLYNTSTGALFYDADGTGEGASVPIAVLTGKPEISANDFLVAA